MFKSLLNNNRSNTVIVFLSRKVPNFGSRLSVVLDAVNHRKRKKQKTKFLTFIFLFLMQGHSVQGK